MKAKPHVIALLSALALLPGWTRLAAEPVRFFFSGQITDRRAEGSVFTDSNSDTFSGYFSYDTAATAIYPGHFPLLMFSIDGNSLNFSTGPDIPFIPGVIIPNLGIPDAPGRIDIRGFYLPAAAENPYDNGSTALSFTDFSGLRFTNATPPANLSLSMFDYMVLAGPSFSSDPAPATFDWGIITQLIQIPEPAAWATLGLGLLLAIFKKRRQT